jgi:alanine-glyoxylate transaminase / serine-glyoxylate transaminase / serine-pyruvate transaminase
MQSLPAPLHPPSRVLLGPGPSVVEPSVLSAMARPTLGHLDPAFLSIMDEVRAMTRAAFRTENELTLPMSGTGSAGMETCVVNLVEPGNRVLVGVNGVFGTRLAEVARRAGGEVVEVAGEWGRAMTADAFREAAKGGQFDVLCIVHAETSTGSLQPIPPIREVADELGALLLVDGVTSLGGHELLVDEWGIDAIYSGTQKCLSCPPGLSPVSFSARARAKIEARKTPVQSWYLDLTLLMGYWGEDRAYHHTAPIQAVYGLHEALRLCLTEGLERRWNRHAVNAAKLVQGLARLGLEPRVPASERLAPLTAVGIPEGIDDGPVRAHMLEHFDVEIGGGLGPMKGNTWRIGLMGAGSTEANVALCLAALESALREQGHTS